MVKNGLILDLEFTHLHGLETWVGSISSVAYNTMEIIKTVPFHRYRTLREM